MGGVSNRHPKEYRKEIKEGIQGRVPILIPGKPF
jgi:hypothetical protein